MRKKKITSEKFLSSCHSVLKLYFATKGSHISSLCIGKIIHEHAFVCDMKFAFTIMVNTSLWDKNLSTLKAFADDNYDEAKNDTIF